MQRVKPTYIVYSLIDAPTIHTDLLWDLTCLFIGLATLYFIAVFYFRNKINAKSKKVALQKKALSPMISAFLFLENDASISEKTEYIDLKIEIRQLLKDDFNRRVLTEILLDLRKDVAGDTQMRLFKLYIDLGLQNDAYEMLQSWRWEVVSKGISELTQMNVGESFNYITKFINDKRGTIRKQAEIATVTLKHEGINYFLDTTTYKISEWQQLKLLDVLRNFEDYQPPAFKAWLTSKNTHTVLFALRLIKFYRQNDAYSSIIELVKHSNHQIKLEAITCIKDFNIVEALKVLKIVFWKSTVAIKISILDTIGAIGNQNDLNFLNSIEAKERSFTVKSKAFSAINAIVPESILPTKDIEDISKYEIPDDLPITDAESPPPTSILNEKVPQEANVRSEIIAAENAQIKSRELLIDAEEVQPQITHPSEEEATADEEPSLKQGNDSEINLGFLPIVVVDPNLASERNKPLSRQEALQDEQEIFDLSVRFEHVQPLAKSQEKTPDLKNNTEKPSIDDPELAFLPLVVEEENRNVSEDTKVEEGQPYKYRINAIPKSQTEGHHDFQVIFEAIDPRILNEKGQGDDCKQSEIIPVPTNGEIPVYHPQSLQDIDMDKTRDMAVFYEIIAVKPEVDHEMTIEWPNDGVFFEYDPNSAASELQRPKEGVEGEDTLFDNSMHPRLKPHFYDAETWAMIQLLDDIEELGDEREIPLLLSFLEKETNVEIRERIRQLVKKFAQREPRTKKIDDSSSKEELSLSYSVIKELFDQGDSEVQIILLDTLVDVMDEKDVDFLQGLKHHPDRRIRKKSKLALSALKKRLKADTTFQSIVLDRTQASSLEKVPLAKTKRIMESPQEVPDIFNIEFELTDLHEHVAHGEKEALSSNRSLIGHLRSFSNVLIEKWHG